LRVTSISQVDVVILAGGAGTRLSCMLPNHPKAMAPVNGRPFLAYLLEQVRRAGARRVILALGYLHEAIERFVGDCSWPGLTIDCVVEPSPRGTGGALAEVAPSVRSDDVLVMNGDTYARVDLGMFLDLHRTRRARCSLAAAHVSDASRYGWVEADPDGRVARFVEKPPHHGEGFVNVGLYLVNSTILRGIPKGRPLSFERDVLPTIGPIHAVLGRFDFIDIGTPESLVRAGAFFEERAA
jgi:NDP-sugar pyrophosphorylase family protein